MPEDKKPVQLTEKHIVAFKDMMRNALEVYFENKHPELDLDNKDLNAFASHLSLVVMDNIGVASKAATEWLKWLKESGQLR